jgi:hypothetical protein
MVRIGKPPYLECSTRGDKRFSAFYAKVRGKSIEEQYQAFKIFEDGTTGLHWRQAKGRKAVNQAEAAAFYKQLWAEYLEANPELKLVLKAASGLSDMFGKPGGVCQATVLWELTRE